jgi:16S rRNA (guanine527-N7)-methyltransferase
LKHVLEQGLADLGLTTDPVVSDLLMAHLDLLKKWSRTYNLTAITKMETMISHHVLDSLAVLPFIKGQTLLDIGTGAGFPGIPLAIMRPDMQVTLLDSNGKKTRFLTQVVNELGLKNVRVVQSRTESYRDECGFDAIISRALGKIGPMMADSMHLLSPGGHYYWMKGQHPQAELTDIEQPYHVDVINVPGLDEARHLVII